MNKCFCYYSVEDAANTMNCSNNNMTHLPHQVLAGTQQLIMAGETFTHVDSVNKELIQIKKYSLKMGNIRHVSNQAWNVLLENADIVNLSCNQMTSISHLLTTNSFKAQLWLGNNPYECNCDMMWMRDWLQNATNVMDKETITCASGKFKGKISCVLCKIFH